MTFMMGHSKQSIYYIKNKGEYKIKDIKLDVYTVKRDESKNLVKTDRNYAKILNSPTVLLPYETKKVKVEVNIPSDYNEVIKVDGKNRIVPFHITFKAYGVEYIEEL